MASAESLLNGAVARLQAISPVGNMGGMDLAVLGLPRLSESVVKQPWILLHKHLLHDMRFLLTHRRL